MPCDTALAPRQTISERAAEVKAAVESLERLLARRKVRAVVGPQGAVAFSGWPEAERRRVTDACAYRLIMARGSALARMEIARAEQLSGRKIDRAVVGRGVHSHDGGATWHGKG